MSGAIARSLCGVQLSITETDVVEILQWHMDFSKQTIGIIGPPPTHSQYKGGPSTPLLAGYSPLPKMGLWGRREEWEFGPYGSHEKNRI